MSQKPLLLFIVLLICLAPALTGEVEVTFTSTLDASTQQAIAYVPESVKGSQSLPLLVVAHCYGADRHFGSNLGYHQEAEKRGWLVITPELHGHRQAGAGSFAALEAQHDVLDAIAYMQAHYTVDASRIYLAGRSMGGMLGMLMAAKHPDLFAGVVAGQGISDLHRWSTDVAMFRDPVEKECGAYTPETAFDYARRSAINYASNLQYVPLILWHGANDTWVPPAQSETLNAAMTRLNRYQPPVHWLLGAAHCPINYPPAWECEQLQYLQNSCEGGMGISTRFYPHLSLVTDEAGSIFWLNITPHTAGQFARVTADLRDGVLTVTTKNIAVLAINTAEIPKDNAISRYTVASDGALTLRIQRGDAVLQSIVVEKKGQGALK